MPIFTPLHNSSYSTKAVVFEVCNQIVTGNLLFPFAELMVSPLEVFRTPVISCTCLSTTIIKTQQCGGEDV